ncbi:MAG TPA: arsenate reductase ArsC [Candidatus Izemoplasmatales bacterium]|nr:arsenate reductase ArsC [Bacillota bacterium]HRY77289.1 arsenate reductase ArsC [Candidatus Izemoplasmatales bacterium]
MIKVAFVCIHNSCRSQIAEALAKLLAGDVFEGYSGGTEAGDRINPDAVRMMKHLYDIDMESTQHSKSITELPRVDIVVTMGCGVECPFLPNRHREDWGLEDPTGKGDLAFEVTIRRIHERILDLRKRILEGLLNPSK